MPVKIEITYNAHKYRDCSDTPKTASHKFTAECFDSAMAKFYDWRRDQNIKHASGQRKTVVGMLTSKYMVDSW